MFSAKLEMGARDPTYFANKQRAIFYTRMYCHGTRPSFFSARHHLQCMQTSHGAANMPMRLAESRPATPSDGGRRTVPKPPWRFCRHADPLGAITIAPQRKGGLLWVQRN